jgi:HTH-type transcriptional regulator / antitoxin HigA
LLIHPGETISDLLEERGMTQKELAQRAGVSEAFLSDVIHGKKDISGGLARGLEYAFDVPVSFWLNLQADYDAELSALQEEESICDDEKKVQTSIHDVVENQGKQKDDSWSAARSIVGTFPEDFMLERNQPQYTDEREPL